MVSLSRHACGKIRVMARCSTDIAEGCTQSTGKGGNERSRRPFLTTACPLENHAGGRGRRVIAILLQLGDTRFDGIWIGGAVNDCGAILCDCRALGHDLAQKT